jgi:phosphomevalonate kinase
MNVVIAPGKLVLAGAYAVLEGASGIVIAVDRYARASERTDDDEPSREVRAAFGDAVTPSCDARELYDGDTKLGLGSSAAVLVASLGHRASSRGEDIADENVRRAIFEDARVAHAIAQGGGSGIDVAASTFGGALRYEMKAVKIAPISLPKTMQIAVFWSMQSARTSDLLARVHAFRDRYPKIYGARIHAIAKASNAALDAAANDSPSQFIDASRANADALSALGHDANAPISSDATRDLMKLAAREDAAFFPSGAGGGDISVYLGVSLPTPSFVSRAGAYGARLLPIGIDLAGVRVERSQDGGPLSATSRQQWVG